MTFTVACYQAGSKNSGTLNRTENKVLTNIIKYEHSFTYIYIKFGNRHKLSEKQFKKKSTIS